MNQDDEQRAVQRAGQDTRQKNTLTLKVQVPTKVLLQCQVTKVIAEAQNGSFCLLPRHIDFVTALTPGILTFTPVGAAGEAGSQEEQYIAADAGILVKCGREVLVSVINAIRGDNLNQLNELVNQHFLQLDEQQRITRSALARLEAGVMRRFGQVEEQRYG